MKHVLCGFHPMLDVFAAIVRNALAGLHRQDRMVILMSLLAEKENEE